MVWFLSPAILLKSCQVTDIISSSVNLKGCCGSSSDESLSKIQYCHDIRPRLYFKKFVGISYNFGYNFCRIFKPQLSYCDMGKQAMQHALLLYSWPLFQLCRGMTFKCVIPVIYWVYQREMHLIIIHWLKTFANTLHTAWNLSLQQVCTIVTIIKLNLCGLSLHDWKLLK